jgi:hypothetical protein
MAPGEERAWIEYAVGGSWCAETPLWERGMENVVETPILILDSESPGPWLKQANCTQPLCTIYAQIVHTTIYNSCCTS